MRLVDLELCTRYGCKNWPSKELVQPSKFYSQVFFLSVKLRLLPRQTSIEEEQGRQCTSYGVKPQKHPQLELLWYLLWH